MHERRRRERVFLSLGSNLGPRAEQLRAALEALSRLDGVVVAATSSVYETDPIGEEEQPAFVNMAAEIETVLEPLELLKAVKAIERELGRTPGPRWGPRPIDIDIVLWGQRTVTGERLTVPHEAFRERAFVLTPLAEIAPEAVDPVTGITVTELARRPNAKGTVRRIDS